MVNCGGGVRRLRERFDHTRTGPDLLEGVAGNHYYRRYRTAERFVTLALLNPVNSELLRRLPALGLPEWWLTSGCLFQTVWNVLSGRNPQSGIHDYDVIYFDPDSSWAAEDRWIRAAREAFVDLGVEVQVRNQARVHLWYPDKFGLPYAPLKRARHALRRYPCRASAVAISVTPEGEMALYAPFGFTPALRMLLDPNARLPIPHIYTAKTARWKTEWPRLQINPWPAEKEK